MIPYYHTDNQFCKAKGINGDHDWLIIDHFCELVNNDAD